MLTQDDQDSEAVEAARRLDLESRAVIGHAAVQFACVIEGNFPGLDTDRVENLAVEFAYRLFMAQQQN